jgi:ankyrin repeat protein
MLDRGADIAAVDQIAKTAMIYAAGQGHTEIVGLLLDAGVDVNKQYKNDLTALMWAAGYGKTDTVKLLLEKGADPKLKDNRGKNARQIAAEAKHQSVADLLAAAEMK